MAHSAPDWAYIQEADSPIQSRLTKIRKRKIDVKDADTAFALSATLNVKTD